jgi:hypothetical protein
MVIQSVIRSSLAAAIRSKTQSQIAVGFFQATEQPRSLRGCSFFCAEIFAASSEFPRRRAARSHCARRRLANQPHFPLHQNPMNSPHTGCTFGVAELGSFVLFSRPLETNSLALRSSINSESSLLWQAELDLIQLNWLEHLRTRLLAKSLAIHGGKMNQPMNKASGDFAAMESDLESIWRR